MTGDEYDSSERARPYKDKSTAELLQGEVDAVHGYMSEGTYDAQNELVFRFLGRYPMMDESGEDPAYWAALSQVHMKILSLAAAGSIHIADKDKVRDFFTGEVM